MYFSLPENIPPRPLGGTGVRKQWSALFYSMVVLVLVLILERPIPERPFLTRPFLERPNLEPTNPRCDQS